MWSLQDSAYKEQHKSAELSTNSRKGNPTAGLENPNKLGCGHSWGPLATFWEPFIAISEFPKQQQQN